MYKEIADFGDFQVVETQTGIDLISLDRTYHIPDEKKIVEVEKRDKRKKKKREEDQTAFTVVMFTMIFMMWMIVYWVMFGY